MQLVLVTALVLPAAAVNFAPPAAVASITNFVPRALEENFLDAVVSSATVQSPHWRWAPDDGKCS